MYSHALYVSYTSPTLSHTELFSFSFSSSLHSIGRLLQNCNILTSFQRESTVWRGEGGGGGGGRGREWEREGKEGSMQGARYGTRSRESGITSWAKGRGLTTETPRRPGSRFFWKGIVGMVRTDWDWEKWALLVHWYSIKTRLLSLLKWRDFLALVVSSWQGIVNREEKNILLLFSLSGPARFLYSFLSANYLRERVKTSQY